jgi:Uma2 family endonuclease
MTEKAKRGAVYEDVIEAPEEKIAEMVEGDLYLSPRPSLRHAHVSSVLGGKLNDAFHHRGPGGWWILDEPELHLLGDVLVPDIAGWRRERLEELPDEPAMSLPPDWLCEILSPSTERFDRLQKLPCYALAEVAFLWLVDPSGRLLEVYTLERDHWSLLERHSGAARMVAPPFQDLAVDLETLWA